MGKDKIATPMLDEFVRQMKPPIDGKVFQPKLDWWFAILVGAVVLAVFIPIFGLDKKNSVGADVFALLAGWATLYYRRTQRTIQIQQQDPATRAAWDRWDRAKRLPFLQRDGLHKYVPGQVLSALEKAARFWHNAREELMSIAVTDPALANEIQGEIDASMMSAVGAASLVTRQNGQGRRAVRLLEGDLDLMNSVCQRIDRESGRLNRWAEDTQVVGSSAETSLRERLAQAQTERAAAETELNDSLGSLRQA